MEPRHKSGELLLPTEELGSDPLLSGDFPKQTELRFATRCEVVFTQVVKDVLQRRQFKEVQAQDLQY